MAEHLADSFIAALHDLEASGSTDRMISMYSEDAELGNVTLSETLTGIEGAREFWTNYRRTFGEVRSEFKNRIATDSTAALEWKTTGTADNGHPIDYDGVSIIEFEDGKIKRFFAYFNPGRLGSQMTEKAHG